MTGLGFSKMSLPFFKTVLAADIQMHSVSICFMVYCYGFKVIHAPIEFENEIDNIGSFLTSEVSTYIHHFLRSDFHIFFLFKYERYTVYKAETNK